MDIDKLTKLHGPVQELITPSGMPIIIRQQNGDDDDVLSNGLLSKDGSSSVKFIASIVVDSSIGLLDINAASKLRLADKYYIIIASRIFSIGQIVKFQYDWGDNKPPIDYEEDLGNFIWDYRMEGFPYKVGDEDYYGFRIKPCQSETEYIVNLKSGKIVRYNCMDSYGEKYLMGLPINQQSKNQELLARNLALETPTGFMDIESFKTFSTIDMMEIRNHVLVNDPTLEIISEVVHPATGAIEYLSILGTTDFFYPREI